MPQTILVTGATGFIAKHIVLRLLNAGYRVIGSARETLRRPEIVAAVTPHLDDATDLEDRLRIVPLDLLRDDGWDRAMAGVDGVIHTASPFPMVQPRDEAEVIGPAVDGALRALRFARRTGISRVVMTSSVAAIVNCELPAGRGEHTEDDWSETDAGDPTPYLKSKTLGERAAWDFVRTEAPDLELAVINPAFVLGPPLDAHYGTSVKVIERLLRARDPMLPRIGFATVDVRDVAEMHLRALQMPGAAGKRFISAERFLSFKEMAEILRDGFRGRRIVTRQAPDFVVRLLGLFDGSIRGILPDLGRESHLSSARARTVLDMEFIPAAQAVTAAAEGVLRLNEM